MELLCDVDMVYVPMLWSAEHWVGLVINLPLKRVDILDWKINHNETPDEVNKYMTPLLFSLPYILATSLPPTLCFPLEDGNSFTSTLPSNIYQNDRSQDYGPCTDKFLEMHACGYSYDDMALIDDKMKYAMDTYKKFIGKAKVANNGQTK
ncbi:hypothetical protein N665_0218s0003 [Sinapis alba]|nr:hypothetical protein N665_0218s0003 [Sinapis alba]